MELTTNEAYGASGMKQVPNVAYGVALQHAIEGQYDRIAQYEVVGPLPTSKAPTTTTITHHEEEPEPEYQVIT